MNLITSTVVMQREASRHKRAGRKIVLVPTMGALHDGHLSLVRLARQKGDVVVMSVYVNPTQFGPKEDFSKYPRPFIKDRRLAQEAGVDILFAPKNLYAEEASTRVVEDFYSQGRCGAFRPGHFDGVTTVVAKLFNIVQPDVAIFGQKDAQQCDVLERMIRDLNFPIRMVRAPIVRDQRGVAMSSRNAYLSGAEYEVAVKFAQTLKSVGSMTEMKRRLGKISGLKVQYVEIANGRLCAAVLVGKTRLIDNVPMKNR